MSTVDAVTYTVETGILAFLVYGYRSTWRWIRGTR
jgi:hypothetical protein